MFITWEYTKILKSGEPENRLFWTELEFSSNGYIKIITNLKFNYKHLNDKLRLEAIKWTSLKYWHVRIKMENSLQY
jgi:protein tyrosine/serine phosphatase